ncbi:MAG TPA: type VI secretion system baseplate subunit TssF, partial [Bacteroidales bacterium]|nr:type VI secretion system baseplate subunit TssF [Bacteroidales bacterium]
MLRNAASIWGFQEPQPENSFDPLVSLLLGACAYELEKISSEINSTESRLIERMVNMLTPHPITSPHPAYAIAFAKPYKTGAKVTSNCQFFSTIKLNNTYEKKAEDKQIFFGPTGTFNLTNGRVRYLAANKVLYEIVDNQYKDIVLEKFKTPIPLNELFIGLELDEKPETLTLFFDLISEHLKQSFYSDLENCEWKVGEDVIDAQKGIKDLNCHEHDIYQLIDQQINLSSKISGFTNSYFSRQFVTLNFKNITKWDDPKKIPVPSALTTAIDPDDLLNIEENTIWIEVKFNKPLSNEVIENMICSLNCFPVINKKLNEYTGSTRELINIIPLHTSDIFFDLKSVTNGDGEVYRIKHFINQNELSKGSALLRSEGVGRFDSRSAMEYLDYLME